MNRDERWAYSMQDRMSDYLLGKLDEAEGSRLEDRVFVDDELFAEMLAEEDRLISDYLEGKLSPEESERFDAYFLSSADRRRQLTVREVVRRDPEKDPQRNDEQRTKSKADAGVGLSGLLRGWRLAFAAASLAMISVAFWLVWPGDQPERSSALQEPIDAATSEPDNSLSLPVEALANETASNSNQSDRTENPLNRNTEAFKKTPATKTTIATLLLSPGATRGGAGRGSVLRLSAPVRTVVLKVPFDSPYHSTFDVVIQTPEGRTVWQRSGLRPGKGATSLSLTVPATTFSHEDYILTLTGREADGQPKKIDELFFSVEKP